MRPKDSNADAWHLFLSEYLDARATVPNGLTFMAVQIAEAIDDALEDRAARVKELERESREYDGTILHFEALNRERDSLRKALDDRFAADQRAARAIFAATGRPSGFPSVKEVVAYYVAEGERLEKEMAAVRSDSQGDF